MRHVLGEAVRNGGPVHTIAVASQKGGVGKSTITIHLAVAAVRAGKRVVILDADPQGSALAWREERTVDEPAVEKVDGDDLAARLRRAEREKVDLVVIDTAPRAAASLASVLKLCDFVIVPVRPSALDLATIDQSVRLVLAAKVPGAIVISSAPPRAPEIAETREALGDIDLPLAPMIVTERRAFARAVATGRAVDEFEPDGPAATEIRELYAYVTRRMK